MMVVVRRFRQITAIAKGINDGGGNVFLLNRHHFPRNNGLCV